MLTHNTTTILSQATDNNTKMAYVFVILLKDNRYVVGQGSNPSKRIACINSGLNKAVKEPNQVKCIIGIKEQNAQRTLPSVVHSFCSKYGLDKVIAV